MPAPLIRAFIAIHLPPAVRDYLDNLVKQWADVAPPGVVRWVKPDAMHVTLRFLGESPAARLETLATQLAVVAGQYPPLQFRLAQSGCFPNSRRPRVIWAGLDGDTALAVELAQRLDQSAVALGWPPDDHSFQPHITLGRVNERRPSPAPLNLPLAQPLSPLVVPVDAFSLMRSQLRPEGPVYTLLRRFPLNGV